MIKDFLDIYRDVSNSTIPILADVWGFKAEIYEPNIQDSLYEQDTDIEYSDSPDWRQNILVTGIFSEGFQGDLSKDNWFEQEIVWYQSWGERLPNKNAKVKIYLDDDGNYLLFRVVEIKELVQGFRVLYKIYLEGIGG